MEVLIENNSVTLDLTFLIVTFHLQIDRSIRTERIVKRGRLDSCKTKEALGAEF